MSDSHRPDDVAVHNERSLNKLAWAIDASVGQFKLFLARCNYTSLRSRLVERLRELTSVEIRILELKTSEKTLYARIQSELDSQQPDALMVFGLESVGDPDELLSATNQVREEFRKNFHFPLVLWVNDQVMEKLLRLAPDFESWAITTEFVVATDELIDFVRQTTQKFFEGNLTLSLEACQEIKLACQYLQSREQLLDLELKASIESLLGFTEYGSSVNKNLDAALEHYQKSLQLWQQGNQLYQQQKLLSKIAFCYYLKSLHYRKVNCPDWQAISQYLRQCFDFFEQSQRLDLVANSILIFGRILRRLQDWEQLETLAQEALQLHQAESQPIELSLDCSFLAEVALANKRWAEAKELAQKALKILSLVPTLQSSHNSSGVVGELPDESVISYVSSFSRFILAQSQHHLDQDQEAVRNLEEAREGGNPDYDPYLYLDILDYLHRLYFEQKEYIKAFESKLERQSIEQQYGFRAFVGAGWIQPQRQAGLALRRVESQETVASEITASGRQLDVERLMERIGRNDSKLIVIHGESGVGKSSLVYGGLVPALKHKAMGTSDVLPVAMRVYTSWVEQLGKLLAGVLKEKGIHLTAPFDSEAAILEQLQHNESRHLRTVLIFDQFEEFFFVYPDPAQRRRFFKFVGACLNILPVKVILSLRKDYLHYLLECNRLPSMKIISNDILTKNVLYELGNFSPADAKAVVQRLTEVSNFHLEPALIEQLVQDLASNVGEVRPIELQIVGAQLQTDNITTLTEYRRRGQKEELVKRYLAEVVSDCGAENEQAAELVLYLLTDEKGTRPLKTRAEVERDLQVLAADFTAEASKLDLVLKIFVDSGLVVLLPELPADRYQLVHDYLAAFIRQQQEPKLNELIAELEREREQRQQLEKQVKTLLQIRETGGHLTELLQLLKQESFAVGELSHHIQVQKDMTVLFADIRSFTSLSETMSLKENFHFLNSYFSRVSPAIRNHNGFIDKFMGDAFMALFPGRVDDAVQAAIEIQKQVSLYNSLRKNIGDQPIAVGIGVNTGSLLLGTVGEVERMETIVISDAVNLASRMETLTKEYGTDILISEQTLYSLDDPQSYNCRFLDRVQVKGKSQPVAVFEVYDADSEELIELKQETRAEFEEGVALYIQKDFAQALQVFQQVFRKNIQDRVAQLYIERCQQARQLSV
jgi:class 3 adenylate cyclase